IPKISNIPPIQNQPSSDQTKQQNYNQEKDQKAIEPKGELSKKQLKEAVDNLNQLAQQSQVYAKFQVYDKTGEYYVQMVNSQTNEVIREIPSKKILEYFSDMQKFLGLLVDHRI
ncbi:MAG TPA: flagellar protein FlaG, partial [Bacillota bacterium]|nr:flagellar protein FlaG [Bacillota bacterium]